MIAPDDALLADCPPLYAGPENTPRQSLQAKDQAERARNICQADKVALRRWKRETLAATKPG